MPRVLSLLWLLLITQLVSAGALPPAVATYRDEIRRVESARGPVSLEELFDAARAAEDALMAIQPDGEHALIETLSEAEYQDLRAQMPGLRLSRSVDVYAQPDATFLRGIAERHGRDADRAFFRLYEQLWGEDLFPRYLAAGQGLALCVRFNEGILPALYRDWRGFVQRYPQAYAGYAQQTVRDLEEAVALGVCTCSDETAVVQELRGFLRQFPDTPVRGAIKARLHELQENPDLRPVHCR